MAIFRSMYDCTAKVGSGGRITIPLDVRDAMRLREGDELLIQLEESQSGKRQFTAYRIRSAPVDPVERSE